MGLIKATLDAAGAVVGDQFKEYVTCPTTDSSVLVVKGDVNHGSGNKNATEGIISNGSKIVVPAGYAMMIIDNGAIKEFSAEPGEFIWDTSSEPSVFEGGFFKGIGDSIKKIGNRITYGGQPARDQRVYYVNLLNITGNKFGSSNTENVFDPVYGSVEINFYGEYSFKVVDPTILVSNLIGANPKDTVTVDEVVGGQLKMQFASNVSTCISNLMTKNNISFNTVQSYKNDVVTAMNTLLDESWHNQYGLEIQDVALNINASEESKKIIREVDAELSREKRRGDLYSSNPSGLMAAATADAMKTAAGNDNGAMMGFMGMNMGQTIGGNAMGMAQNMTPTDGTNAVENPMNNQAAPGNVDLGVNTTAKFCSECGASVTGKFCSNCGKEIK
ncbi:MAG: SPFH domain-containing protein [Bacilli bacterium]|nr:SPFH domain-containing protein [Bacilli bacterium]